jgi:hypothetical protein
MQVLFHVHIIKRVHAIMLQTDKIDALHWFGKSVGAVVYCSGEKSLYYIFISSQSFF